MYGWGLLVGGILLAGLLSLCVQAGFLLLGARLAAVEQRSFGRALLIVLVSAAGGAALWAEAVVMPLYSQVLIFVGGLLVPVVMAALVFRTTFGKAIVASVLGWMLGAIVVGGTVAAGAVGLGFLALHGTSAIATTGNSADVQTKDVQVTSSARREGPARTTSGEVAATARPVLSKRRPAR